MRFPILYYSLLLTAPLLAQDALAPKNGAAEIRGSVREWIETMQKIQKEEDAWEKDNEILKGYKEGLTKEIEDLNAQIERAKTRKLSADKESTDKISERDRFTKAQEELTRQVAVLESALSKKLPLLPETLQKMPKNAEAIDLLKKSIALPADQQATDVSKRLFSAVELLAEIEKFQQGIHIHQELRKDLKDREFKMDVIYFGLAYAYAVNEDGSFAAVGRSSEQGWKFTERNDLAPQIQLLLASASSEKDATFSQLPLIQP